MEKKPLLCRLGLHKQYNYLPKVGGDLGEISISCKRCGYGYRYFTETWDIPPSQVQEEIAQQVEIEFGRVLVIDSYDPLGAMKMAYAFIKSNFSEEELKPIQKQIREMEELETIIK